MHRDGQGRTELRRQPFVSEQDERGSDEEFRLQIDALTSFDRDEKKAAKAVLDALILKHQARRWASAS